MNLPRWDGWHLIGSYESDVGSWLLHHGGEAALLEVPEGLVVRDVRRALRRLGVTLRYATASHDHEDHLDAELWQELGRAFPSADLLHPRDLTGDTLRDVGGEPLWLLKGPKHSRADVVTVFRGVAMTGDIELGTLESVSDEVPRRTRRASMRWLQGFAERTGYRVHASVSAHLDDVRTEIDWPQLFRVEG